MNAFSLVHLPLDAARESLPGGNDRQAESPAGERIERSFVLSVLLVAICGVLVFGVLA